MCVRETQTQRQRQEEGWRVRWGAGGEDGEENV